MVYTEVKASNSTVIDRNPFKPSVSFQPTIVEELATLQKDARGSRCCQQLTDVGTTLLLSTTHKQVHVLMPSKVLESHKL